MAMATVFIYRLAGASGRGLWARWVTGDFYGQDCRDKNIKSGTGWCVDRVVRLQETWRLRKVEGMGVQYGASRRGYIPMRN